MDAYAIVPQAPGSEGFVELSRTKKGRLFEKHILNFGDLRYNGRTIRIDDEFYSIMERNFKNNVCDIVQVPKAGAHNEHTEDPDRNIGEVIGLSKRDGKIYAQFDARDEDAANKLGKTLLGASAMFHLDYEDKRTGKRVGPTLIHLAVTNRPYVTELEDYQEILLSRGADSSEEAGVWSAATKENFKMDLEDLITALKVDHNIDVRALQADAEKVDKAVALTAQIRQDILDAGFVALSDTDEEPLATAEALSGAIESAAAQIVELTAKLADRELEDARKDAETRVDALIADARIVSDKREAYIKLAMNDPETFAELVPEGALVSLSDEQGSEDAPEVEPTDAPEDEDAAVARILAYEGFSFSARK